jgi:serine/threonine protein kinase
MISQLISHYRILNKLGEGGMGEVYLGEDIRLGRQVAIKFLPASYQYDSDRRTRFLGEARAASALRSPYIAAIYDIGEHDGALFIVMEYVEGKLLSRRISRGTIPYREAVEIVIQVADALDEAHSLGILHRDIKSSNLMVTDRGLVKVLDFGLAKAIAKAEGESDQTVPLGQQTMPGIVLGTISYMSPEQAFGRDLDGRSDIFSLGIVFYEMLTSRLPFVGNSTTEIIDNIIHQQPTAISQYISDLPESLDALVRKCLEKDREHRYQSARELAGDLKEFKRADDSGSLAYSAGPRQTGASRRRPARRNVDSLAILPFENASDDPDAEYLSDGITESIINNLSQLQKLRVMARSTVFRYKGRRVDPQQVGSELDVRAVLTGRVFQRAETLVIKSELVDAADGSHLWGEQYNRQMSDIFAIEEEISKEISEKLRLKLSGAQRKQLAKRYTDNTEAYQLYLRGRFYWNKRTEEGLKRGIDYFQQAINTDPKYALAYTGLADSYNVFASYSALAPKDAFPKSKAAALRALDMDDKLAEAHASLAFVLFGYDWDWDAAEASFKRSIELNSGYAVAYLWYALLLAALERFDEAFEQMKRAQLLDPLSLPISTNFGWILHLARRYGEAIDQLHKTIEMEPGFALARRRLAQSYAQLGRYGEAEEELAKGAVLSGEDAELIAARGHLYASWGKAEKALESLKQLDELSMTRYVPSYLIARIYIGLGQTDLVFKYLDKAYAERYGFLAYLKADPIFDELRSDPRYWTLVEKVGLSAQQD